MSWFKRLFDKANPPTGPIFVSTPESKSAAEKAVDSAEAELCAARGRRSEVDRVVRRLDDQRKRNHFGELLEGTMRGSG